MSGDVRTGTRHYTASDIETIARTANEANRGYCESIGDPAPDPWTQLSEGVRESVLDGVRFHLERPAAGPGASHDNWCAFKRAQGWRYGDVKSEQHRTHPNLLPYYELPEAQRRKDILFIAVVRALS